ncbi:acyl-CoA dehydrogenase family protein [Nakamurella lactea]|uniref:acyl-CoA dehydrogenase family protein n=1 Tax=Nakamurella lactea TaxID=459515 RepID=UPI0004185665|nr:acyl-CoA dehydrogenase family protein [Nakamurella lactea]
MDFHLSEDQKAVRDLAAGVFARHADPLRLPDIESTEDRFDRVLWQQLAEAGVLGLAIDEQHGGAGLGLQELAMVLPEQGRTLGTVPLWETVIGGALPLIRYGTQEQQAQWLPRIADGSAVLTVALEPIGAARPWRTSVSASGDDGGWALTGTAVGVPAGHLAEAIVVPATTDAGIELFLVRTDQSPVGRQRYERTDRGIAVDLELAGAAAERLAGGPQDDRLDWLLRQCWIALAGLQVGISQSAVRQAAEYTSMRHQFGVPLATFQAVAHQAADCHIDTEAMEVTFLNAVWREATGRDAGAAAHVAQWWASEAGDRVARTVQHLHGGLGADVTYPIHRYMLWTTQLANTLGSASWHLQQLSDQIAESAA